jgi:hypothetical protein
MAGAGLFFFLLFSSACAHGPVYQEGSISQKTGLALQDGHWNRMWWADQFESAKSKGCHLEDSCGVFPPYYLGAEYCGEPETVCPGYQWGHGGKPVAYTQDELRIINGAKK